VLAALVAVDLWTVARKYWIFSAPGRVLFASDPAIDFMRAAKEPGRVVSADFTGSAVARDPTFFGAAFMGHRVRSVTGYHGNELGRYQTLIGPRHERGFRPEFWRHENVHYLYTTLPDSLITQAASQLGWRGQFTKLVGPVRNAVGSTVYLYRVPGDNRAAWVATAMVKGNDDQALATVLDERFDPERAAIIDTAASIQVANLTTVPASAGVKASVTLYEPGRINVQLDNAVPAGAALVVSENYFPGWHARANGQSASVVRANFNLIGVVLPAGAREVQLSFTDPAYEKGKTVTLIALLVTLLAIAAGVVVDRRRVAPAV
jgi:hypothetical protein